MMKTRYCGFLGFLLLASCGPAQNDPGPGGVTVGEAEALDAAAEMLDERNMSSEDESGAAETAQ
ncbi:hypothetical protein [Sphingorhabdus sp. EL138]|jgi:hypothetical protein|uniref:hypothetical protein n=1 Tax=Sphingorhabdus sp. EL138 TaxID=2073156 RepID=UPI0020B11EC0|nr:hypothetical protein [Sphingorhabdus sp. EL138]